jgi:hypothetical protein
MINHIQAVFAAAALVLSTSAAHAGSAGGPRLSEPVVTSPATTSAVRNFQLSFTADRVGLSGVEGSYRVLSYPIAQFNNTLAAVAGYDYRNSEVYIGAEYATAAPVVGALSGYASVDVLYTASTDNLRGGDFSTATAIGVQYQLNSQLFGYAEASTRWNISDNWTRQGTLVEIGAEYAITPSFAVRPSIAREIGASGTSAQIQATARF